MEAPGRGATPGSVQPHIPSFPAIPAKTTREEVALPLARSAAAAGQPCSPPPPPPAAPLLPCLQEGWSRALCLGLGRGMRCRTTEQMWATWMFLFPLPSCCHGACVSHSRGSSRETTSAVARHSSACPPLPAAPVLCPALLFPPSLLGAPLPGPRLRHRAALGFGNLIRAVPGADASALPLAPSSVSQAGARAASRFGLGCCMALGKRQTAVCCGKGP